MPSFVQHRRRTSGGGNVEFTGQGGERVSAFLYLPKADSPYHGSNIWRAPGRLVGVPITDAVESPPHSSGRAIFIVVLEGVRRALTGDVRKSRMRFARTPRRDGELGGRYAARCRRPGDTARHRSSQIAFWNDSTYNYASVFAALEKRYAAVIMVSPGAYFDSSGGFRQP